MTTAATPTVPTGTTGQTDPPSQHRRNRRTPRQPQNSSADSGPLATAPPSNARSRGGRAPRRGTSRIDPASTPALEDPVVSSTHRDAGNGAPAPRGSRTRRRAGGNRSDQPAHETYQTRQTQPLRMANGRHFGGQLTQSTPNESADLSLHGDAPAFTPGQPHAPRTQPSAPRARPPKRRLSKSMAPDLPTRIHEDIDNGQYECAICTNEVFRNSKVWSCKTCWTVFHLACVKKWAGSDGSARSQQQSQDGDLPPPRQWRCPGCNLPQEHTPTAFTCWCAKETDPKSLPGLPPFSCGQTCTREHIIPKKCPHPCNEICHAGPCLACPSMGPTQICFCGKETKTKRCVETDYDNGWSCGAVCGELLPCGEHYCEQPCHEGLCGACEVSLPARCHCGKVEKELKCCDKGEEKDSARDGETWVGVFDCGGMCSRSFDCGKHTCEQRCHPQAAETPHCPRSPDVVEHCPCGKTALTAISDVPRTSCVDPIPHCNKVCAKSLSCGHTCQQACHTGNCLPCMQVVDIRCRCGRTASRTVCHQGSEEPPQCARICRTNLNCGRHQCDERCCNGERKAAERLAAKRKPRSLESAPRALEEGFEAEHICTRQCGRLLRCGTHQCQELCHRGPCGSCREAIFDDITCNCGRTVLQSPLPCGTKPPPCRYDCERSKACGHPQVAHNCHMDDESCPKCPFLTTKFCLCRKQQLKNQPCWLTEVRCGEVCGKMLACGTHRCQKLCHRPGACEDAVEHCHQECGQEKSCGHADSAPCHAPSPCKEDKPCQHKIFVTCPCQRIKKEAGCSATRHTRGNLDKVLDCDDECARIKRNHKLAVALNIDPDTHKDDHIPYSAETLNMFLSNIQWAQAQEKELRLLAADAERKRLRFNPMQRHQRAFVHSLAEDFGFDSESMDPEPHRHVAIFKTPRFVMAPMKTLAECARIRNSQRLVAAQAPVAPAQQKTPKPSNVVTDPFNSYLLTNPTFGLTLQDLYAAIRPKLAASDNLDLEISFLPSEEVVLRALRTTSTPQEEHDLDAALKGYKSSLATIVKSHRFGDLQLCRVDGSLNVLRREADSAANGGWSQVAAKAAAPKRAPVQPTVGVRNNFTVLGSSIAKKGKSKPTTVEAVDDWEAAEAAEEEKERDASANASGASGDETGQIAAHATQ